MVSVVIAQVAQAMLLAVQHLFLSSTMLCFHLHTRYLACTQEKTRFLRIPHPGKGGDSDWVPAC